jgi:ribosomal-protein-alanine N-acetyltransferase
MDGCRLEIGGYEEGDLREIIAIEKTSFPTPWSEMIFRHEIAFPLSRMVVGRCCKDQERGVAGYLIYWLIVDEIHIQHIAVRQEMRRRGIATKMLEEALGQSHLEGSRRVTLEVRRSNLPAQRMYDKLGFSVKGLRTGYYSDTREDALIMWADLPLTPLGSGDYAEKRGGGND